MVAVRVVVVAGGNRKIVVSVFGSGRAVCSVLFGFLQVGYKYEWGRRGTQALAGILDRGAFELIIR